MRVFTLLLISASSTYLTSSTIVWELYYSICMCQSLFIFILYKQANNRKEMKTLNRIAANIPKKEDKRVWVVLEAYRILIRGCQSCFHLIYLLKKISIDWSTQYKWFIYFSSNRIHMSCRKGKNKRKYNEVNLMIMRTNFWCGICMSSSGLNYKWFPIVMHADEDIHAQ